MMKFFLTYIASLLLLHCCAQLPAPESKLEAFEKLQHKLPDSTRQSLFNYLGSVYYAESWQEPEIIDSAFYYLRKAVYLGDSLNVHNNALTNESLTLLAETYLQSGNTRLAKKIFNQVLQLYRAHAQIANEAGLWRKVGRELWNAAGEFDYSIDCLDNALRLYNIEGNVYAKAEVLIDKINFYVGKGKTSEAEQVLQQLLKLARSNNYDHFSYIFTMLAKEQRYKGNFNKALEYALQSVQYESYTPDKKMLHNFYGELAQVYQELGEAEKSAYWYEKCIREREKIGFPVFIMYRTMSLMVVQLLKIGKAEEAIYSLRQLEQKMPPLTHSDKASLAQSYAYCYAALHRNDIAGKKFLEMISEYSFVQTHKEILSIAYLDIGKFFVNTGQYEKAGNYLKTSAIYAKNSAALSRQKDLYLLLFKVDSAMGNFSSAIKNFQYYKELNDSIFSEVKSQQISDLMIRYESDKKDDNIKFLEKEQTLQRGKIVQANQTRNWILGVAVLLLMITGLLVNNARIKQRNNKKLKLQQTEIQSKNEILQSLLKEKEWLVKEIHHRVKNNFHMVMGLLGTQSGYLKSAEAIEAMSESQHRVHAMSLIHQKLYQSENLSAIDISDYIHELVNYLRDSFSIKKFIQFNIDVDPAELDLSHCLPLGLIINEGVTNSIKYAFPMEKEGVIAISFKCAGVNNYRLTLRDNGIGLPQDLVAAKTSSMGLNLMQGLSDDIDGVFKIYNDDGTVIQLDFFYNRDSNFI